jgi:hypothetical protein
MHRRTYSLGWMHKDVNFRSLKFLDLTWEEIQCMLTFLVAQGQTHCHQQHCTRKKIQ